MSDTAPSSRISQRRKSAKTGAAPDYTAKRTELLRVAAEVFRDKGYAAATLNDVAAKFGTDRASLYYYVGSKKELFQECVTETYVQNLAAFNKITEENLPPRARIEAIIRVFIEGQVENYPTTYVFIQEDMAQLSSMDSAWARDMAAYTKQIEQHVLLALKDGVSMGDFRSDLPIALVANSLFGMTQWTHRWYVPHQSRFTADDLIHTFSTVLLAGIAAPERDPSTPRS